MLIFIVTYDEQESFSFMMSTEKYYYSVNNTTLFGIISTFTELKSVIISNFLGWQKKKKMFSSTCSGSKHTSRWRHSPTTPCAGRSPAQRGLVFELGLHDDVMFVLQVQKDGPELLILTQI